MITAFTSIFHSLYLNCRTTGGPLQIRNDDKVVVDLVESAGLRRNDNTKLQITAVEVEGIGMEWSMTKMSYVRGTRERGSTTRRRENEVGAAVLRGSGELMILATGEMVEERIEVTEIATMIGTEIEEGAEMIGIEVDRIINDYMLTSAYPYFITCRPTCYTPFMRRVIGKL
jgi:hypothetical protein